MKKLSSIIIVLFFVNNLYSQEKDSTNKFVFLKHEVRLSYGMETFPNFHLNNLFLGGFTANYMYRVVKWFWVGGNINWQFPSDIEYYRWSEYYADGTFKDFEISARNNFLAIAPELRFSYTNKKWTTLYSALSAGYGIHTGIHKKNQLNDFFNNYWFWNITFFGANFHIGKKQSFILGFEFGLGFKGAINVHAGYRF